MLKKLGWVFCNVTTFDFNNTDLSRPATVSTLFHTSRRPCCAVYGVGTLWYFKGSSASQFFLPRVQYFIYYIDVFDSRASVLRHFWGNSGRHYEQRALKLLLYHMFWI